MKKGFTDSSWKDFLYWQKKDEDILKKITELIKDIDCNGNDGLGNPEILENGYWSRRIDEKNRLVYKIDGDCINIIQCKGHYDD